MSAIRTFGTTMPRGITVPRGQGEVGQTSKLGAESAAPRVRAVSVDLSPWLLWSGRCSLRRRESRLALFVVLRWDGVKLRHPELPAGLPRTKDAKSEPDEVARMRFNEHTCSATADAWGAFARIPTV